MIFQKSTEKRDAFIEIIQEYPKTRKELNIPKYENIKSILTVNNSTSCSSHRKNDE